MTETLTQKQAVQGTLFGFAKNGILEAATQTIVDQVLEHHKALFTGETPRNSVRRTLSDMQADGLVIRDGKGLLRFNIAGIRNCVIKGDVLEVLRMCPDNSIPLCSADPAWQYMAAHLAKGSQTRMMGASNNFYDTGDLPEEVVQEIYRTLMPGGIFMCWFPPAQEEGQDVWIDTLTSIRRAGFSMLRQASWCKGKGGGYGLAPSKEEVFVFFKDQRPTPGNGLYDLSVTNVLVYPRMTADSKTKYDDFTTADQAEWDRLLAQYGSNKKIPKETRASLRTASHQAEKPIPVLKDLLRVFLGPGKHGQAEPDRRLVMDLYSGSGSCSDAASQLEADFIAVELDQRNVDHLIVPRLGGKVRTIIQMRNETTTTTSEGLDDES